MTNDTPMSDPNDKQKCGTCGGVGKVMQAATDFSPTIKMPCDFCHGTGIVPSNTAPPFGLSSEPCPRCTPRVDGSAAEVKRYYWSDETGKVYPGKPSKHGWHREMVLASAYYAVVAERDERFQQAQEAANRADEAERQRDALASRVAELERDAGKLPKEPPAGLLMSMAIRYDHGLGVPGFYDAPYMGNPHGFHARKLEATLRTMRQLYEEVSGHGFWSPENDCEYVAQKDAALSKGAQT